MKTRRPNPRLVKIHRNYTVEEISDLFGVHKNTVRAWIKRGLSVCDSKRPALILGRELAAFINAQRGARKHPCKPGELYCMRCRQPRQPAGNAAEFEQISLTVGNLRAICPVCSAVMNKSVSLERLEQASEQLNLVKRHKTPSE